MYSCTRYGQPSCTPTSTARTTRALGMHGSSEHASIYTEEEIKQLVNISHKSGHLEEEERRLINRVFDF